MFLEGCGLPERWIGRRRFAIGEIGFGAGLNALAAWQAWAGPQAPPRAPGAVLHFVSIEAFPMARADAERALGAFPEVAARAGRLLEAWPVRARAPQRLWFPEDGFCLTVFHEAAETALAALVGRFDAWFLDGFSPARNGDAWTPSLMQAIAARSAPDARLASYTVAGGVRSALEAAGFAWRKRPGFAAKRERLEAWRTPASPPSAEPPTPRVAIIGGGIAGAAAAAAFLRRGVSPVVLACDAPAASANPAALLTPRLDRGRTPLARAFLAAYLAALRAYGAALSPIGVIERPGRGQEDAFADLLRDPPLPETHLAAGPDGALRHPLAGVLDSPRAIAGLLAGAERRACAPLQGLERAEGRWRITDRAGATLQADCVVLATGAGLAGAPQTAWLPLDCSRGQLDWAPIAAPPAHALAGGGYCAPFGDQLMFGATFDPVPCDGSVAADAASSARNYAALNALAPGLSGRLDPAGGGARAAVRAALPDRVPIAGAAPDAALWKALNPNAPHGARARAGAAPVHPGLFVIGGLGARGFLTAPLLGEIVAAQALGEPAPLDAEALSALSPERFLTRLARRPRRT